MGRTAPIKKVDPLAAEAAGPTVTSKGPTAPLKTDDIKIEQQPDLVTDADHAERATIIAADPVNADAEQLANLKFNEEPVTIRLEPSSDKNASPVHPVWNNGKGCEVLIGDKWYEMTHLPIGKEVTIKRKYVATLASAKIDTVSTKVLDPEGEHPQNVTERVTTALVTFSVLEDRNPRGRAWLTELVRRNM